MLSTRRAFVLRIAKSLKAQNTSSGLSSSRVRRVFLQGLTYLHAAEVCLILQQWVPYHLEAMHRAGTPFELLEVTPLTVVTITTRWVGVYHSGLTDVDCRTMQIWMML